MVRKPGVFSKLSKKAQVKMNSYIPEKIHSAITATIKQMIRSVLFGVKLAGKQPISPASLEEAEIKATELIKKHRKTGAIEGGITGAGGILMGLADFPLLVGIKFKLLFDLAAAYGFDVRDYKERLYFLFIFQLAFSSPQHRKKIYLQMEQWEEFKNTLPDNINEFDWRAFQQEYRDYIDLSKMAQLIPGIGAVVGVVVNYNLLGKLGTTAMNAYRMRLYFSGNKI